MMNSAGKNAPCVTLLTNATLIDCVEPVASPGASVLIEDGRIARIACERAAIDHVRQLQLVRKEGRIVSDKRA